MSRGVINGDEVFKQSRALKNISTNTKTYVREVREILRAVINPAGPPHPWQSFDYEKAGINTHCEYRTFTEYLDKWSRMTLQQLRDLFHADTAVLDLLDVATKQRAGRPETVDNVHDTTDRPDGNAAAAGLRRLRKDRPDLHQRVIAGEMTTHAAMVDAGFRTRTITVPFDMNKAAEAILRHFTPEQAIAIARVIVHQRVIAEDLNEEERLGHVLKLASDLGVAHLLGGGA
jgi:hypothetical protein